MFIGGLRARTQTPTNKTRPAAAAENTLGITSVLLSHKCAGLAKGIRWERNGTDDEMECKEVVAKQAKGLNLLLYEKQINHSLL